MSTILVKLRLFVLAGSASIMPPLGPVLAQYGVNSVQFCTEFNDQTGMLMQFNSPEFDTFDSLTDLNEDDEDDLIPLQLVVDITIYTNKTYSFVVRKPTVRHILSTFYSIKRCRPHRVVARMNLRTLFLIAIFKFPKLPLYSSAQIVRGTARSLGVKIIK